MVVIGQPLPSKDADPKGAKGKQPKSEGNGNGEQEGGGGEQLLQVRGVFQKCVSIISSVRFLGSSILIGKQVKNLCLSLLIK